MRSHECGDDGRQCSGELPVWSGAFLFVVGRTVAAIESRGLESIQDDGDRKIDHGNEHAEIYIKDCLP